MDIRTSSLSGRKSPMVSGLPDGPEEIIQVTQEIYTCMYIRINNN